MPPAAAHAETRERCQDLAGSLHCPVPYRVEPFAASLGRLLRSEVRLAPLRLPVKCQALWLGFTGADRVYCNADWPGHEIELAGHAIGHLLLGHCGDMRDGGQFACTTGDLGEDDRRQLSRHLHDLSDGGVSRLFGDGEERAAGVFARVLAERLGLAPRGADHGVPYANATLACVG